MSLFPKIIVVANGKGGVGKTTTAMALSGIFAEKYKVLAVDTDIQRSFSWWAERGEKQIKFDLTKETNPTLLSHLRTVEGYELAVVDTAPALNSEALTAVIAIADYLVLPTPPAPMDLAVLIETVNKALAPVGTNHRVLLTRVDSRRTREALEAQNTLRKLGIPAFQAFIRTYKAHEQAALEGIPISQLRGESAHEAKADYRRVADEIQRDWRRKNG